MRIGLVFAAVAVLVLSGCGGGGGSNTLPYADSPQAALVHAGAVAKSAGCVLEFGRNSGAEVDVAIATGATYAKVPGQQGGTAIKSSASSITLSPTTPVATFTVSAAHGPINVNSRHCPSEIWSDHVYPVYQARTLTVEVGRADVAGTCTTQWFGMSAAGKIERNVQASLNASYDLAGSTITPPPLLPASGGLGVTPTNLVLTSEAPSAPVSITSSTFNGWIQAPQNTWYGLRPLGSQCAGIAIPSWMQMHPPGADSFSVAFAQPNITRSIESR